MWAAATAGCACARAAHACAAADSAAARRAPMQVPTQNFFTNDFGLPLTMKPNFEDLSWVAAHAAACDWSLHRRGGGSSSTAAAAPALPCPAQAQAPASTSCR